MYRRGYYENPRHRKCGCSIYTVTDPDGRLEFGVNRCYIGHKKKTVRKWINRVKRKEGKKGRLVI